MLKFLFLSFFFKIFFFYNILITHCVGHQLRLIYVEQQKVKTCTESYHKNVSVRVQVN